MCWHLPIPVLSASGPTRSRWGGWKWRQRQCGEHKERGQRRVGPCSCPAGGMLHFQWSPWAALELPGVGDNSWKGHHGDWDEGDRSRDVPFGNGLCAHGPLCPCWGSLQSYPGCRGMGAACAIAWLCGILGPHCPVCPCSAWMEELGVSPPIYSVLLRWHHPWVGAGLSMEQVRQVTGGRCEGTYSDWASEPNSHIPSPRDNSELASSRCSGPQHPTKPEPFLMRHGHPCLTSVPSITWVALSTWKPSLIRSRSHFADAMEELRAVDIHRILLYMDDVHPIAVAPALHTELWFTSTWCWFRG